MGWSKVSKGRKPPGWWYHKILCEFWYAVGNDKLYYKHLNIMIYKYRINLYGVNYCVL
jgi:hypothetical protein